MRSLLLHALSQAGLGLRRLDSEDIADTSKVTVTAQAVAAKRNDTALEQIVGRLSLEPNVSAATWQIDRTVRSPDLPRRLDLLSNSADLFSRRECAPFSSEGSCASFLIG